MTIGSPLARRIGFAQALGYWIARFIGGHIGAEVVSLMFRQSSLHSTSVQGLGIDGYGAASLIHRSAGGAFLVEVILTALFDFVILSVADTQGNATTAGLAIGLTSTVEHLIGIPLIGTSANPARTLGPALVVGGTVLSPVWLFLVAPLVGGIVAAIVHAALYPCEANQYSSWTSRATRPSRGRARVLVAPSGCGG